MRTLTQANRMMVAGHRGDCYNCFENTMIDIEPWIGAGVTIESRLRECFDMGVGLITTNFPTDCIRKLERIGAR